MFEEKFKKSRENKLQIESSETKLAYLTTLLDKMFALLAFKVEEIVFLGLQETIFKFSTIFSMISQQFKVSTLLSSNPIEM